MYWFVIYFIPSFTYYFASTTPTLVQAVASRFRGRVKIRKVVLVEDSGSCVEVQPSSACPRFHSSGTPLMFSRAATSMGRLPVRFLFRPVGPFTKELAKRLTSDIDRPVTLVDGFYLGADKSELAMQHDCMTMVASGVALSPYLTLLPALLNRIAMAERIGNNPKTKSIVLHWVVRESGLCHYYFENYLNSIVKRARVLNLDSTLAVHVYLTGDNKPVDNSSSKLTIEASSFTNEPADLTPDDTVEAGSGSSDQDKSSNNGQDHHVTPIDKNSPGHPLELARMLPRRYSSALWNIPFFVYYTVVTLFGFRYLFNESAFDPMNYYDLSKVTWIILYAVLMYFGFGIFSEACVLCLCKYWPQPQPDTFEIVPKEKKRRRRINQLIAKQERMNVAS